MYETHVFELLVSYNNNVETKALPTPTGNRVKLCETLSEWSTEMLPPPLDNEH